MVARHINISDYRKTHVELDVNASHIHVWEGAKGRASTKLLWKRDEPMSPEWYDEKHTRIVEAIYELEAAVLDVVKP